MKELTINSYVDICLMTIHEGELSVLTMKRSKEPFKNAWSLPGGAWYSDMELSQAASMQLFRKTGLRDVYLEQLKTYGGPSRDPRGPSCSVAYLGLVSFDKVKDQLISQEDEEFRWYPVNKITQLAFDHNQIVMDAKERIVNKIRYTKVGFELVGEYFTMKELVDTFEKVIDDKIDQSNLRKKLLKLNIIKPTKEKKIEGKGRPSPVFKLDSINLRKLPITESFFRKV